MLPCQQKWCQPYASSRHITRNELAESLEANAGCAE